MTISTQDPVVARIDLACGGLLPLVPAWESRRVAVEAKDGRLGGWITRRELRKRVARLAPRLERPTKSVVFVLTRNDVATLTAFLAARAAGHAVALLDAKAPPDTLTALVEAYEPEFILSSDGGSPGRTPSAIEGVSIVEGSRNGAEPRRELALLLSTSGTTGTAKFVRLSEAAVLANARQIVSALHIAPRDVGIGHLALHYSYGMSVVTSHLVGGAAVVLIDDSIMTPTFWSSVAQAGGTHFPGVPFHYTTLARLGLDRLVPASVTTFTQAGGALDLRFQQLAHEQATARGGRFYVMYGQTEAAPRMTTLPSDDFAVKKGSVGVALDGGRLSILGSNGAEAAPGAQGEVIYFGANVMMGYASRRADLALPDEQGGRLATGDLGYLDQDGFLFLTGRSKRISKMFGLRINLDEIEQGLSGLGPCAALDAGERIVVFHEAAAGAEGQIGRLAEQLGLPSTAFKAKAIDALPRMASGKTDYTALKDML